jgi:carboxypeptidase Q
MTRIIDAALASPRAWEMLTELCDDIGHRLSGSPGLDRAIAWALARLTAAGHESVRAEPVQVPKWVRGDESLWLSEPRRPLSLLGLGGSVGTASDGVTARVVVVADEAELDARAAEVKGAIVLFNNPMPPHHPEKGTGYGEAVRFRSKGPGLAAKYGAVGVLVRSVTARSLYTPHTGATSTKEGPPPVPAAAVPTEDAELLSRLYRRGKAPVVTLTMGARDHGLVPSANVVAELRGRERPDEIVIISGHLDSWDVGQGAHDDGSGVVMAMASLDLLRSLGLTPRRTIRVVLWTNEENGLRGALGYAEAHATELSRHVAAIEADTGCYEPVGYRVEHRDPASSVAAVTLMEALLAPLKSIGATHAELGFAGADLIPLRDAGVLLLGQHMDMSSYFDIHHTAADTLDKVDPSHLANNVATMAATAWALAETDALPLSPTPVP